MNFHFSLLIFILLKTFFSNLCIFQYRHIFHPNLKFIPYNFYYLLLQFLNFILILVILFINQHNSFLIILIFFRVFKYELHIFILIILSLVDFNLIINLYFLLIIMKFIHLLLIIHLLSNLMFYFFALNHKFHFFYFLIYVQLILSIFNNLQLFQPFLIWNQLNFYQNSQQSNHIVQGCLQNSKLFQKSFLIIQHQFMFQHFVFNQKVSCIMLRHLNLLNL